MEQIKTYQEGECYVLEAIRDPNNMYELKVFNPDYFRDIGFPNATVSIVGEGGDIIKGGYYENPDELTWPFRQFVYMVQPSSIPGEPTTSQESISFYEKIFGTTAAPKESVLDKLFQRVNSFFTRQTQPVEPEPPVVEPVEQPVVEQQLVVEPVEQPVVEQQLVVEPLVVEPVEQPVEQPVVEQQLVVEPVEQPVEQQPVVEPMVEQPVVEQPAGLTKWKVTVCDVEAEDVTIQRLREYRANKIRGIKMESESLYKLGPREIMFGKIVEGESEIKISDAPEGTLGYKWLKAKNV